MQYFCKKYKNNKLYCLEKAGYINLTDIVQWYSKGDTCIVIDHVTKKEITSEVLSHALRPLLANCPTYWVEDILGTLIENSQLVLRRP